MFSTSLFANQDKAFQLKSYIDQVLPDNAQWSLVAIDVATGKELVNTGKNNARALRSGSLTKLITSGAAYDQNTTLGSPRMQTILDYDGAINGYELQGNLYLIGNGNALLTAKDFQLFVDELLIRGVSSISGDIIVDETLFDVNGLERTRKGSAQAIAGALGLDLHTVSIMVSPDKVGKPPLIKVDPANNSVRIANSARTAVAGMASIKADQLDDLSYKITGNIPAGSAPFRKRFPLKDPGIYAGETLRSFLADKCITLDGKVKRATTPKGLKHLAYVASPDFDALVRDMNMNSLNVVADNMLLMLGGQRFGSPGTREKGLKAVDEFLKKMELPEDEIRVADGSGLHADNKVTAAFMAMYLQKVFNKAWFSSFYDSLPRVGMDGTLRDYGFRDGRIRAKTGTLEDAYALAGYCEDKSGRKVAFTFIINHPGVWLMNMNMVGTAVLKHISYEVYP